MQPFQLACSQQENAVAAVDECLSQIDWSENGHALAFVYLTDPFSTELGNILRMLREKSSVSHWVGTIGTAVLCTGREFYDQPAMVMLVTDIPESAFQIFSDMDKLGKLDTGNSLLNVSIVHGDPRNQKVPELLERLPDQIGNGYLAGGLTSSQSYYYQIADSIEEGRITGVVFDDSVTVVTGVTQGCSPISEVHTLTECDGNVAISIDGRPALQVLKEDIGEILSKDLRRIGGYIFAGFPIKGTDTGDYTIRNLIGLDEEHGLVGIGEYLQPSTPIMFCRRDSETAVEDLKRMLTDVKSRLRGQARGGLYFSCLGRGKHMFGSADQEMNYLQQELGDIPIVGFYANGEIAGNRLYGFTGVLVLFE